MAELKKLQKDLKTNQDEKRKYVEGRSESSDSEEEDGVRIVPTKKVKKNPVDTMLVEELVRQQKIYVEVKDDMARISQELDREETKNRYLTLDLSNAQLKIEELSAFQKETWILRIVIAIYVLFRLFCFYHWVSS